MSTFLTPLDRVKKAHVAIMNHREFCMFAGVLACGKTTINETMNPPTARTNGWDKEYHPDFVKKLDDRELRFLVLHEAMHAAYKHMMVWRPLYEENAQLTNVAADAFINLSLTDSDPDESFIKMPKCGVPPMPKYRGWSVKQIFDDLKQQSQDQGQGQGQGQGDDGDGHGGLDSHDWDEAGKPSEAEQAQRALEIDRALRQGVMTAKRRGAGNGSTDGLIGDLLKPKVDWREQLREFVQEFCQGRDESTWRKPNRRYIASGIYMPSSISERMDEVVVGIDTSGSCFESGTVTRFASELQAIFDSVKPDTVRVVCWDWGVQTDQSFPDGTFNIPSLKVRGGGGTDGGVLFQHLQEHKSSPQAIIQFTDGCVGDWGSSDVPTLWVITEPSIRAPWGRTIHMTV